MLGKINAVVVPGVLHQRSDCKLSYSSGPQFLHLYMGVLVIVGISDCCLVTNKSF